MSDLNVCLVSPVPPPYGGISIWTVLMHRFSNRHQGVRFTQVDTAVHWRAVWDAVLWKRVVGGGFQLLQVFFTFLTILRTKPDLVHLTTSGHLGTIRDLLIGVAAYLLGVPLTYHLRIGRVPRIAAAKTPEWQLLALVMRMASVVLAVDRPTARTIRSLLKARVEYAPNGIDLSELPALEKHDSNVNTMLFLGWVLPSKGIEELVEAWSELEPQGWELWIAGPVEQSYQEYLIQRFQPTRLRFLGELKHGEAMALMARCGIFVLPSHTEGFPNVILEAMAYSKPIIATAVGAIPEMLHGNCGILVGPKKVQELKAAMVQLIQDDQLRREYGERARERLLLKYSFDAAFDRYVRIWMSIVPRSKEDTFNQLEW